MRCAVLGPKRPPPSDQPTHGAGERHESGAERAKPDAGRHHHRNDQERHEHHEGAAQSERPVEPSSNGDADPASGVAQVLRTVVKARPATGEVAYGADAHEADRDAPGEPGPIDLELAPHEGDAERQEYRREREAANSEHDFQRLGDGVSHRAEHVRLSERHEKTRDDQQDYPNITFVTLPDGGVVRGRGLSGRRTLRRPPSRLLLVSCGCHNHPTYRTQVRNGCQST